MSPLGLNVADTWQGVVEGRSGVELITAFDTLGFTSRVAASVKGFDPTQYLDAKEARRLSLFIQYAVAAAGQAVDQAGLTFPEAESERVGVEIGAALGGTGLVEEQRHALEQRGLPRCQPDAHPRDPH